VSRDRRAVREKIEMNQRSESVFREFLGQARSERHLCQTCLTLLTLVAYLAGQASRFLTLVLPHALEMRGSYCISANFVESSSSPWALVN
jgi:hypothetical protein